MKDSKNENGARVVDVPPPAEDGDPKGRWSIEERDQLLLREREARLEAEVMRDANLALTQDLSLERTLETLLDYLRKLVPFDSANVMLVGGDSYFVTSAIRGYEDFLEDLSLAKGTSFSPKTNALLRQICETKQSLLISDTKDESRWQSIPGSEHIRNWIGVPLFAHDEIMGLYSLDKAQPGYFTAEHVRKAESLAAQAATAIRNAQLFGRVERYVAELEQLVAERKRAENAVREAEHNYREIFENAGEGIFQSTPDGKFISANPALARMHGFDSPEDLISSRDDISRQIYVDSARREEFKRLLEEHGVVRGFEHRVSRKDGSKIWISVNARAVRDDDGAIRYYEGTAQDINERKRAEARSTAFAALARKLSGARTPLDAARIIAQTAADLFEWDSFDFRLYDADRDLIHHTLSVDTIDGPHTDFTASISDQKPTARSRRVIDHGPELQLREEPIQFDPDAIPFGDKTKPSASIMTVPVRHAAKIVGILSVQSYTLHHYDGAGLADLEALADHCGEALNRIRAEESLSASEERYRELFENAKDVIYVHDLGGRYISVNRAAERLSGYTREEILGKHYSNFVAPSHLQHVRKHLSEKVDEESGTIYEVLVITKDGRRVPVELSSRLIYENGVVVAVQGTARDITDRKRAEAALRESEERLRLALDAAHMGTFDWDVPRNRTTWSRWHEELWGFKPGEFGGTYEAFAERVHHDDLPGINADIARCIAAREPSVREFRVVWPDGSVHWMQSRGDFTFGDDGQPVRMRGVVVETTARRLAEEALRTSEERLRVGLKTANIAVFNQDLDLRYIWMYQPRLGYTSEQVTGHTDAELLPPEAARQVMEIKRRVLESGLKEHAEVPVSVGGQTFVYDLVVEPLRDANSAIIGLTGASLDITERKRAEAALQESEERFRQLSEAPFEAIILHDQGTILEVNQSFCRMYGYERAEVIGKSVLDLTLPEFRELLLQRVQSGGTGPYEGLALRKDGTIFRTEVAGKPIHYQGRVVRVAAIRDITEQKRNEQRQTAQYAVTRVLAESATLAEATPQLLQVICETLRWKIGEFWRVCDSTNLLRCVERWHAPALDATSFIEASRQLEFAPGDGLPGRVWQSGQPAWTPDVTKDPRFARAEIAAKVGLCCAVAFPILLGNQTLGVMLFFSRSAPDVDEDLLKIMSAIGSQIGQFIERKRAEQALKQSEQDFRNLFEQAHDAILVFDPEHEIVLDVNERACELYGLTRSEFIGMSLEAISKDVVRWKNKIGKTLERGDYLNFETVQYRKDGSEMFLEINASTILYQGQLVILTINRDVTERRRAEDELRVKDNAIESSVTPTVFADLDGRISYVNGAFLKLFGYERADEVLGRPNTEFVPRPEDIQLITASLRERGSWAGELEAQKQNGSPVYLELVAGLVRDARGRPICTMATLADSTERRRTEAALRESEERYRDLVENSRELICTHDLNGVVLSANPAAAAVLGYDLDELVGRNIQDNLAPEVRDQFDEYMARLLKDGATSGLMLVQTKSGEIRVWDYYNSLRTKGVAAPIVRGMARDITEQRRAQTALGESEERYRELFENARDAIYVHDLSGRYTSVNRAAEELSGYRREEIIGRHYSNFVAPSHLKYARESFCKKLDETLETNYEAEIISKNGRRTPVEISSRLIYENGVPIGIQGTARDISERKQTQEALRIYSRALIDTQETERQNIARELHDEIGQVFTAIRINLESIRGLCQTDGCLPQIEDSIVVVDEALERVRDLSLSLRPSLLDNLGLNAALRWYVDRYAQRTGIAAEVRCSPREHRLRREVATACFRIVQEALTNVARHAKAQRVTVQLKKIRERLMLTVKDDGVGFDREILSNSAATALGLRGMEERAHSVGGSIEISSQLLKGTQIRAAFPIEIESGARSRSASKVFKRRDGIGKVA